MRRLPALLLPLLLLTPLAQAAQPETDWLELMPEEDRQALEAMPEISHEGSEGDSGFYGKGGLKQQAGLPAVMYSARTVAALDRQSIRLSGYPVPLEADRKGRFRSFMLVPYPGACIHVPPPPPNQIVLVRYPQGVALDDIYAPLRISGTLHVEHSDNQLASAAYTLDASKVEVIEDSGAD